MEGHAGRHGNGDDDRRSSAARPGAIGDETFCLTYGDCVSDIDIWALVAFHRSSNALGTLTAIQPPGRFGALSWRDRDTVSTFHEKPDGDGGWVNGGFFVLEPDIFDYIDGDQTVLERAPLETLASLGRLNAYRHTGYWQNLDSLRDKEGPRTRMGFGVAWLEDLVTRARRSLPRSSA